jgi:hypothetical protein
MSRRYDPHVGFDALRTAFDPKLPCQRKVTLVAAQSGIALT